MKLRALAFHQGAEKDAITVQKMRLVPKLSKWKESSP